MFNGGSPEWLLIKPENQSFWRPEPPLEPIAHLTEGNDNEGRKSYRVGIVFGLNPRVARASQRFPSQANSDLAGQLEG